MKTPLIFWVLRALGQKPSLEVRRASLSDARMGRLLYRGPSPRAAMEALSTLQYGARYEVFVHLRAGGGELDSVEAAIATLAPNALAPAGGNRRAPEEPPPSLSIEHDDCETPVPEFLRPRPGAFIPVERNIRYETDAEGRTFGYIEEPLSGGGKTTVGIAEVARRAGWPDPDGPTQLDLDSSAPTTVKL